MVWNDCALEMNTCPNPKNEETNKPINQTNKTNIQINETVFTFCGVPRFLEFRRPCVFSGTSWSLRLNGDVGHVDVGVILNLYHSVVHICIGNQHLISPAADKCRKLIHFDLMLRADVVGEGKCQKLLRPILTRASSVNLQTISSMCVTLFYGFQMIMPIFHKMWDPA